MTARDVRFMKCPFEKIKKIAATTSHVVCSDFVYPHMGNLQSKHCLQFGSGVVCSSRQGSQKCSVKAIWPDIFHFIRTFTPYMGSQVDTLPGWNKTSRDFQFQRLKSKGEVRPFLEKCRQQQDRKFALQYARSSDQPTGWSRFFCPVPGLALLDRKSVV